MMLAQRIILITKREKLHKKYMKTQNYALSSTNLEKNYWLIMYNFLM